MPKDLKGLATSVAKLLKKHHLDYDQTKHVFKLVRAELRLKPPRRRSQGTVKRLSQTEIEALLKTAFDWNPTTGLMLITLYETATRVGEFVNLQPDDLLFDELRVVIRHGKGDKRREVPITKNLAYALQVHLDGRRRGYVFESNRASKFTPRRIQQIVAIVVERASLLKKVTPHTLRHTRATLLVERGMSKDLLQVFLGHDKPETTQIYTHTAALDMQRGFNEATETPA